MRTQMCVARRNTGSFMLGFAALTATLAILCSTALLRSFETYRASALAVQKLQARAAGEGAAVAWSRGALPPGEKLELGECVATLDGETSASVGTELRLSVGVFPKHGKAAVLQCRYLAMAESPTSGTRRIRSMELIP